MQQPMNLEAWKTTALRYGRLKNDPILRAVLPRNQVGCLVGFGGQTSQHLQNTHNVLLQFFSVENARWGRLMSIKGSPSNQGKAWYECAILLLKQYYDNYKEFGFSLDFLFPTELIELLLLQDDFQRIANESRTKIRVKYNCLMRSTERVVRVYTQDLSPASLKGFEIFVYLIADLVRVNNKLYLCASDNVFYIERAEDEISKFMKYDTENDMVFYPQGDIAQQQSKFIPKDGSKREIRLDSEESEQWNRRGDVKGRESGSSSYYDAVSEEGDFENLNLDETEDEYEEVQEVGEHDVEDALNECEQDVDKVLCENENSDILKEPSEQNNVKAEVIQSSNEETDEEGASEETNERSKEKVTIETNEVTKEANCETIEDASKKAKRKGEKDAGEEVSTPEKAKESEKNERKVMKEKEVKKYIKENASSDEENTDSNGRKNESDEKDGVLLKDAVTLPQTEVCKSLSEPPFSSVKTDQIDQDVEYEAENLAEKSGNKSESSHD
ncbi:unnamed protein product [Mucor hiemalis]